MKKIVIIAAAMVMGIVAHGASIQWSMAGVALDPKGGAASTYTAYLISTDTLAYSSAASTLGSGDLSALNSALMSSAGIAVGTTAARWTQTGGTVSPGETVSAYVVVVNGDQSSYFLSSKTITSTVPQAGNLVMSFGAQTGGSWNPASPTPPPDTPEPTSGLLLVVGGAMLALRRKQK